MVVGKWYKPYKYTKIVITVLFTISFFNISSALIISEIMYDAPSSDTGKEWIEIYNETTSPVDITEYYFIDNGVKESKKISPINNGTNTSNFINPGEYIIIITGTSISSSTFSGAESYLGKAFYTGSGVSFLQDGEVVGISGPNEELRISYSPMDGSNGKGETLNNISLSKSSTTIEWKSFIATPGATSSLLNIATSSSSSGNSSSPSVSSVASNNTYNTGYSSHTYTIGDFRVIVPKDIYTLAGKETFIPSASTNFKGDLIKSDIVWNFGDGAFLATTTARYIYKNPGDYIVTIEAQQQGGWLYGIERVNVHVDAPDIIISKVKLENSQYVNYDEDKNGYIEIYNRNDTESDIGGFVIQTNGGTFTLSKYLIIPANSKLKIYNNIMNLSNLENAKLLFPNKRILYQYKTDSQYQEESKLTTITVLGSVKNNINIDKTRNVININTGKMENINIVPAINNTNSSTTVVMNTDIASTTIDNTTNKISNIVINNKYINPKPILNDNIKITVTTSTNSYPQTTNNNTLPFWKKLLYYIYD